MGSPGHRVQVRDQLVAELHRLARHAQHLGVVPAPGTPLVESAARAVQPEDRAENAVLHPARVELRLLDAAGMPADVVAPPAVTDVGRRRGEIGLEPEAAPGHPRVAREADRVAVIAQPAPARKDEGAFAPVAAQVQKVQVIQPPQRVEPVQACFVALLPVQPPEVDAARFLRVVEHLEVRRREGRVGQIVGHRLAARRVDAHSPGHRRVRLLMGMDAICRVQVERGAQALLVQEAQEAGRVGEQLAVPGVAGPAGAGVAGLGDVPLHVDDAHRERDLVRFEVEHQAGQLVLGIGPEAAPPVAQRPAWHHRHRPGDPAEVVQRGLVVVPIGEEIQVERAGRGPARRDPARLVEHQRRRIVDQRPARAREQARLQRDRPGSAVQRARRAAQVPVSGVAEAPHRAVGLDFHRQAVRREPLGGRVVRQRQGGRVDGDDPVRGCRGEVRHRLAAEPDRLAGAVLEDAVRAGFQPDQARREHGEAGARPVDHSRRVGGGFGMGCEMGKGGHKYSKGSMRSGTGARVGALAAHSSAFCAEFTLYFRRGFV